MKLDSIRGLVRPFITVTGWVTILFLAIVLVLRYADREVALMLLTFLTGSITTLLGFWFGERKVGKEWRP